MNNQRTYKPVLTPRQQNIVASHEKQIKRLHEVGYPIGFVCELEFVTPEPPVEILDAIPFKVCSDALDRMEYGQ